MPFITPEAMREIDRRTIQDYGVSAAVLMDRAGRGVADAVWRLALLRGDVPEVTLVAGRGNNGGDAFVAARYLAERGLVVRVLATCAGEAFRGAAREHLERLAAVGVTVEERLEEVAWERAGAADMAEGGICVDGILGTGVRGAPRGVAAAAIRWIERCRERQVVVAIDLPSGMDGLTGLTDGEGVTADLTVSMAFPKQGMLTPAGQACCGAVEVVDIGVPPALAAELPTAPELLCVPVLRPRLVRRAHNAHKGTCGHVLVIGGARGYSGAVALAAGGALRSGAGLVSVLTTEWSRPVLAGLPEAMVRTGPTSEDGVLLPEALAHAPGLLSGFDAVVAGPGLGRQQASRALVMELLRCEGLRLVLDADALNVLAGDLSIVRDAAAEVILTPHPGEAARLLGVDTQEVQVDRRETLSRLCSASGATVVLKGQGTWVGAPGADDAICLAGNPGLATGGTGDVLSGIIAGLAAQGAAAYDAVCLGVYLHAAAGDMAARRGSEAGMIAGDVLAALPSAIRQLAGR